MTERVHFRDPLRNVVACGHNGRTLRFGKSPPELPTRTSSDPAEVTCSPCKRSRAYRAALPHLPEATP